MLTQLQCQFDLVPTAMDFSSYRVVIVPENIGVEPELKERLRGFARAGGAVVLVGEAATEPPGQPLLAEQGVEVCGGSPYSATALHAGAELQHGLADYPFVMHDQGLRIKARAGSEALLQIGEPYFERAYDRFSGHSYTPENGVSEYAGVVRNGKMVTISFPLFGASPRRRNMPAALLRCRC